MVAPQDAHRRQAAPDRGLVAQGGAFTVRRALAGHPRLGEAVVRALDDVPCDGGARARREAIAIETASRRLISVAFFSRDHMSEGRPISFLLSPAWSRA